MPSFQSLQEFPHQQLFFDLNDKNYKKAKMKGGLGWMKNIGNDPARFLMGTIFLVCRPVPYLPEYKSHIETQFDLIFSTKV